MKTVLLLSLLILITSFTTDTYPTTPEIHIFGSRPCMPEYKGGEMELLKFLRQNTKSPQGWINYDTTLVKVVIKFEVTPTGKVVNAKVAKGEYGAFTKEALRVVSMLPDFVPCPNAKDTTWFCIPFQFKL